jgi:hypothetical protein
MRQIEKTHFNLNLSSPEVAIPEKQSEIGNGSSVKEGTIILQPITMRIPNNQGVYSLSKLRPKKAVSYTEFWQQYARYAREIRVCFAETPSPDTLLQQSAWVRAYSLGWSGWYIIDLSEDTLR